LPGAQRWGRRIGVAEIRHRRLHRAAAAYTDE
jgi:hypothetical protein